MLEVRNLRKSYGETLAISDISFRVEPQEFVCVVGPSGCGKTTLLKCMSGLLPVTSGEVLLDGHRVDSPPQSMALVFQEYGRSLFPWMTVRQNVAFPLSNRSLTRKEVVRRVDEALARGGDWTCVRRYRFS